MNHSLNQHQAKTAPYKGKLEAFDPDEQANNLKDWEQQYDQISHGNFYGRIDEIQLDQIHLFKEFTNQAIHQKCNVWPNGIWIGFSANQKNYRFNGEIIPSATATIQAGNSQFDLVTPENFSIHGIVLKQSALDKMAQIQGLDLSFLQTSPVVKLKSSRQQSLSYVLGEFISAENTQLPSPLQQELLIMNLLDSLETDNTVNIREHHPSFSRRRSIVNKVRDYIHAHPDKAFTITELCEIAHVSRRTLQYSFEDVMGLTPLKYMKIARLNTVRRTLLSQSDSDETISSIAARHGFWHAGQFTHDYTQLFGENPSVTLEKRRLASTFFY